MKAGDLDEADRIMRLAFGTFLGLPDPMKFMGDANYVKTRFRADPPAALAAEIDGKLVGSNFALDWGSVGIFGPLTIHPEYWNMGVARSLLDETMKIFKSWGTRHMGLYTFADSAKHVHLYQQYGFWPRQLVAIMSKLLEPKARLKGNGSISLSTLGSGEKKKAISGCANLTGQVFEGLDLRKEILSVNSQNLGDTILVRDSSGTHLNGIGICHVGPGTEAGSDVCYVKFAAARNSEGFDRLLDACESYAISRNALRLTAGVNTGRHDAYRRMIERGFRTGMQGVAMHNPNDPGYSLPNVYAIDDWR